MRFHCATCDDDYAPATGSFRSPECGAIGQVTSDGCELLIESMGIET